MLNNYRDLSRGGARERALAQWPDLSLDMNPVPDKSLCRNYTAVAALRAAHADDRSGSEIQVAAAAAVRDSARQSAGTAAAVDFAMWFVGSAAAADFAKWFAGAAAVYHNHVSIGRHDRDFAEACRILDAAADSCA
jgi:hypothetical protein